MITSYPALNPSDQCHSFSVLEWTEILRGVLKPAALKGIERVGSFFIALSHSVFNQLSD